MKQTAIAEIIGVHKCTICRGIKRNVPKRAQGAKIYVDCKADAKPGIGINLKRNKCF